eukprot:g63020.t1
MFQGVLFSSCTLARPVHSLGNLSSNLHSLYMSRYPESLRKKLGALMEQFELSFRIYEQGPSSSVHATPRSARPRSAELLAPLPSEHQLGVSLVLGVLPHLCYRVSCAGCTNTCLSPRVRMQAVWG